MVILSLPFLSFRSHSLTAYFDLSLHLSTQENWASRFMANYELSSERLYKEIENYISLLLKFRKGPQIFEGRKCSQRDWYLVTIFAYHNLLYIYIYIYIYNRKSFTLKYVMQFILSYYLCYIYF